MHRRIGLVVLFALVGILVAERALSADKESGSGDFTPRVGVLEIAYVLSQSRELQSVKAAGDAEFGMLTGKKAGVAERVKKLREEMDLAGEADFARLESEIQRLLWEQKSEEAFQQNRVGRLLFRTMQRVYVKIDDAVRKISEEKRLDFVLVENPTTVDQVKEAKDPEQLKAVFASRILITTGKRLDISADVLKIINK